MPAASLAIEGFAGAAWAPRFAPPRRLPRGSFAVQRRAWHGRAARFVTGSPLARSEDSASGELQDVRAIAAGDSAAFRRLIERESPRLLRFALGLLGSLEEAEDVVQDTIVSLWENAATWRPEARIGTWLHRVCYNRAIDRLRRRRTFVDDGVLGDLADPAPLPELRLVRDEEARDLRAAIAALGPRQRTAVLLFHLQDLSQREAAVVMGVSEAALEALLARARRQMRRILGGDGGNDD